MSPLEIVLLVLGILGAQAILWVLVLLWLKRKAASAAIAVHDQLARSGEHIERAPESAVYRGASSRFSKVKGNGVIALTDRRLVFRKLFGSEIEVARGEIVALREDKWFLRAYCGRTHLILKLADDTEIGFIVRDHAAWMAALKPG
jgi:hypothetical protein